MGVDPVCMGVVVASLAGDRQARLPGCGGNAGGDAGGDVRRRVHPPGHRAHRLRVVRQTAGGLAYLQEPSDIFGVEIPRSRSSRSWPRPCASPPSSSCSGGPGRLHMRAASMDFGTARMLGVRANRVITAPSSSRDPGCGRHRDALRGADPGHEHIAVGHDLRDEGVVLAGLNRPIPATSAASRSAPPSGSCRGPADEPEPVPAELHLRRGDRRSSPRGERAFHPRDRAVERL